MLIATITAITILLSGGGAHWGFGEMLDNLSKQIGKQVQSEAEIAASLALVGDSQASVQSFESLVIDARRDLWAIDSNYDATEDDFRHAFDGLHTAWDDMERKFVDTQVALRDHITEEEWNAIYAELKKKRK